MSFRPCAFHNSKTIFSFLNWFKTIPYVEFGLTNVYNFFQNGQSALIFIRIKEKQKKKLSIFYFYMSDTLLKAQTVQTQSSAHSAPKKTYFSTESLTKNHSISSLKPFNKVPNDLHLRSQKEKKSHGSFNHHRTKRDFVTITILTNIKSRKYVYLQLNK